MTPFEPGIAAEAIPAPTMKVATAASNIRSPRVLNVSIMVVSSPISRLFWAGSPRGSRLRRAPVGLGAAGDQELLRQLAGRAGRAEGAADPSDPDALAVGPGE